MVNTINIFLCLVWLHLYINTFAGVRFYVWANVCVPFSLCPNEWTNKIWLNFTRSVHQKQGIKIFFKCIPFNILFDAWAGYSFSSLTLWFQSILERFFVSTSFRFSYYNLIVVIVSTNRTLTGWLAGYEIMNYAIDILWYALCYLYADVNRQFDFFSYFRFLLNRQRDEQQKNCLIECPNANWLQQSTSNRLASTKAIKYELCHRPIHNI